jgi:hypothetical protein
MSEPGGMVDVDAEGHVAMEVFDSAPHRFTLLTFMQLRDRLIEADLLTEAEADAYIAAYNRAGLSGNRCDLDVGVGSQTRGLSSRQECLSRTTALANLEGPYRRSTLRKSWR